MLNMGCSNNNETCQLYDPTATCIGNCCCQQPLIENPRIENPLLPRPLLRDDPNATKVKVGNKNCVSLGLTLLLMSLLRAFL